MGKSIKDAVKDIAEKLEIRDGEHTTLSQWLYIFTKGYVSNLRSRRALPNDYWTAETVEDYMRCKVINFPIGVHNEEMRRDAFRTWIISRKLADEREKDKKNLFVCTYNPSTQEVSFVKNICLNVETKVETLGLLEHINLGTVQVRRDRSLSARHTFLFSLRSQNSFCLTCYLARRLLQEPEFFSDEFSQYKMNVTRGWRD